MKNIEFGNEKEELEYYREFKNKKSREIQEEILKLLDLPYKQEDWEKRLYLLPLGKSTLILLKNAITKKLKIELKNGEEKS